MELGLERKREAFQERTKRREVLVCYEAAGGGANR